MNPFLKLSLTLAIAVTVLSFVLKPTYAVGASVSPKNPNENTPTVTVSFTGLVADGRRYRVCLSKDCIDRGGIKGADWFEQEAATGGKLTFIVCGKGNNLKKNCGDNDYFHGGKTYSAAIFPPGTDFTDPLTKAEFFVRHYIPEVNLSPKNAKPTDQLTITITGNRRPANNSDRNKYDFDLIGVDGTPDPNDPNDLVVPPSGSAQRIFGPLETGNYSLNVRYQGESFILYTINFTVENDADGGSQEKIKDPGNENINGAGGVPGENPCGAGNTCPTALGDIPTTPGAFAQKILSIAIGLAGGIAFILMVIGSIRVLTSSGDQQRLAGGREMIVAALAGLLFLIFSVLILRFIGVHIIGL